MVPTWSNRSPSLYVKTRIFRKITFVLRAKELIKELTTPTCFSSFYRCAMVPTLVESSKFFMYLLTFLKIIIMTGEATHTASKMVPRTPAISIVV